MQKEHSNYAFLFTLPDPALQPERVLWLHVIAQSVIDASSRDRSIKKEVSDWVDTEDFETVCGMGGVQIEHISYIIHAILQDRNRKRAFKRAMEFRFLVRSYVESYTGSVDK